MENQKAKLTHEEIEEESYLLWIETGGPAKMEAEHEELAKDSLKELQAMGWDVLTSKLSRHLFEDFRLTEAVIRKGNVVKLIRWSCGLGDRWTARDEAGGWTIFDPTQRAV